MTQVLNDLNTWRFNILPQKCSSSRKLEILLLVNSCYFFCWGAGDIVSVGLFGCRLKEYQTIQVRPHESCYATLYPGEGYSHAKKNRVYSSGIFIRTPTKRYQDPGLWMWLKIFVITTRYQF